MTTRIEKLNTGAHDNSVIEQLVSMVRRWAREEVMKQKLRQERRQLACLSDEMLSDIGINRGDAEIEASRTDIPCARRGFDHGE